MIVRVGLKPAKASKVQGFIALILVLLSAFHNLWAQAETVALPLANAAAPSTSLHALEANKEYEPAIVDVLESLQLGKLDEALQQVDAHLSRFPKSRIAHLLRADILKAHGGALTQIGQGSALPENELLGLTHQLKNRWQHNKLHNEFAHQKLPDALLHMGDHPYVLVADMPKGRLYVYENNEGQPELIRDYYMSVGSAGFGKEVEGDNKTPIGVYHVNRYIEGKRLPDLYGKGAFPVNYPNKYDRFLKRTGYGIWLHGTPSSTYARSPWTSEGCFVLSNDDLLDIAQFVDADLKTPVILSDGINWVSRDELNQRRQHFLNVVTRWKNDWESVNTESYLSHYTTDKLNFGATSYASWEQKKRKLNATKTFIQVDLDIHELFLYPGKSDMFVVRFTQNYLSNNYQGQTEKKQYWQRSKEGDWKIIYEG